MGFNNGNGFAVALVVKMLAALTIMLIVVIGVGLGLALAETRNIINNENFTEFAPALPTRILDINGIVITEFAAEERRELVSICELPRHLINAVLAREDPDFFNHRGFSVRAIARAAWGQLIGRPMGGGSTITQQVAGTLHTDRRERTIRRKIVELWYAIQMERRFTKNEILEIYLNYMIMGPGTFGVEAASRYFFGHSARDVTLAESAILAVLLSSPTRFNPLNNPNETMNRQRFVLDRMVEFGFTTREEAEASFREYWDNYDFTRESVAAYFTREDRAPWFSEMVRRELGQLMFGTMNYHRDGFTVHTTMNLHHQQAAERIVAEGLERANASFARSSTRTYAQAEQVFVPIVDMLTLLFDFTDIRTTVEGQAEGRAVSRYVRTINPIVDMLGLAFGIPELKDITNIAFAQQRTTTERNVVEGALISIENETGHITAVVGGSRFDQSNQFIRATQANVQTGSAFKTLYFSAAIDTRQFTAGSIIYDVPMVFHNEDGTPYIPLNFRGVWRGPVLFVDVLAQSMNVPSLKIMDTIGFDATIDRSAALLDITNPNQIRTMFPRVYPLGLGITSTSPLRMARAYAVFGNQGRAVEPISIRSIEDRNGRIIIDLERDLRQRQRRMGDNIQVVSPQNAYIMTRVMQRTVEAGSLANAAGWGAQFTFSDDQGSFRLPVAGKTGTTQNWADAWVVGYSPFYTTAVWFGFDRPGNSLGVELTGATLAGPVWASYMREIHRGLPRRSFSRPVGVVDVEICVRSGRLRGPSCARGLTLPFLEGTQPNQFCDTHGNISPFGSVARSGASFTPIGVGGFDASSLIDDLPMPQLPLDLLPELREPPRQQQQQRTTRTTRQPAPRGTTGGANVRGTVPPPAVNPFLDDGPIEVFDDPEIEPLQVIDEPISLQIPVLPVIDESNIPITPLLPPSQEEIPSPFPEAVIQFVPGRQEDLIEYEDDNDLPSWNPLD